MTAPDRLFGLPGDECLETSLRSVYENRIDGRAGDLAETFIVEEWDCRPPADHLPDAEVVAEWIAEYAAETGELDEHGSEDYDGAIQSADVVALLKAALVLAAAKTTYRMAGEIVAHHRITFTPVSGTPLVDGQPMFPGEPTT